jgi:hypothetical protein
MTVHDKKIRVSLSDRGGVVFHFDGFEVTNTVSGKWCCSSNNHDHKYFDTILGAFWHGMKWPETVQAEQFAHLVIKESE